MESGNEAGEWSLGMRLVATVWLAAHVHMRESTWSMTSVDIALLYHLACVYITT